MLDKYQIFENIGSYTAEQIVEFINQGIVTPEELERPSNTAGEYSYEVRKKVNEMLQGREPEDWQRARTVNTQESYQQYLDTYPNGQYRDEARDCCNWKKALASNTKEAYQQYLDNNPSGQFREDAFQKMAETDKPSDGDWDGVDKNNFDSLNYYISTHPDSPHRMEAERLVRKLQNERGMEMLTDIDMAAMTKKIKNIQANKKVLNQDEVIYDMIIEALNRKNGSGICREDLIEALRQDKNMLSATVVHKLYDEGWIGYADFSKIGIDKEFVQHMLEDIPPQRFGQSAPLVQISRHSTEIYFWGIPSSGKSCALGGILSVANNGKVVSYMRKDPNCQGIGYMSRLMVQFNSDGSVGTLPEGTSTTSTYEMGFDLTDNMGMIHPITCIDLAGEMIRCMFKSDSGEDMSDDELMTLDTLTNILVDNRTGNRKIHFFVIEYGADDRLYEGLPQKTYLEAAVEYIDNHDIFRKDTDAIFILVSKVDKAPAGIPRNEAAIQYLNNSYKGFVNRLKGVCQMNEINGGNIDVIPFSLGEVCFQNYCRFQEAAAVEVVRKIVERSAGFKSDKFNKLKDKLRG